MTTLAPQHFRLIRSLLAFALLLQLASAQLLNFTPGNLPQCAQGCDNLNKAQSACTPPQAAAATQQEYQVCFCQSAYLQNPPLKQTGAGVCPACTSASDQQQLQQWYSKLCTTGQGAAGVTSSAAVAPSSTTSSSDATRSPGQAAETSLAPSQGYDPTKPNWWSAHGRWIAMIIVIVVAFAIIIVVGLIWKRRYNARRNRASATPLPTSGWGPNMNPHSYPGPVEKGFAASDAAPIPSPTSGRMQPQQPPQKPNRVSKRLSKLIGR